MYGKLQELSKLALVEAGDKGVPGWTQAARSLWVVFSATVGKAQVGQDAPGRKITSDGTIRDPRHLWDT